jgi:hypothetical protein
MRFSKWIGLAALLVVGATLFASPPASAGKYVPLPLILLQNAGDEPEASGQVWQSKWATVGEDDSGRPLLALRTAVTCQGLTPGASYWTQVGTFRAKKDGKGQTSGTIVLSYPWVLVVNVDRLNADGSSTPVLYGESE